MTTFFPEFWVSAQGQISVEPYTLSDGKNQEIHLPGRCLIPGFANAHSHAFQRALRGHVEQRSATEDDSFWTWRDTMYALVNTLSLDDIEEIATLAYREMVAAGFVAVGEFHYVHHDLKGVPYSQPWAVSSRLARAASHAGIRLVLLQSAYERAGAGLELRADQARFNTRDAQSFLDFSEEIRRALPGVAHGLSLHSVRACSDKTIALVGEYSKAHALPLHIHACEQRAELEQCHAEHGKSPVEFLRDQGALHEMTTLVHATHLSDEDIRAIAKSGAGVCLCPSTERNLGDGLCPIRDLHRAGVSLSIGTDQHVRIDAIDELRAVEEQERLRTESRSVLQKPGQFLAQSLLPIANNGFAQLGLSPDDGDLIAVDIPQVYEIKDRALAKEEVSLDSILLSATQAQIDRVYRKGVAVYERSPLS